MGNGRDAQELGDPRTDAGVKIETMKGFIRLALNAKLGEMKAPNVEVQETPKKGVFATNAIAKDDLSLLGWTPYIFVASQGKSPPSGCIALGSVTLPKEVGGFTAKVALACAPYNSPNMIVPFWIVQSTEDTAKANMCLRTEKIEMIKGSLQVPMMQNKRALKAGEELLIYNPERKKGIGKDTGDQSPSQPSFQPIPRALVCLCLPMLIRTHLAHPSQSLFANALAGNFG